MTNLFFFFGTALDPPSCWGPEAVLPKTLSSGMLTVCRSDGAHGQRGMERVIDITFITATSDSEAGKAS